MNTQSRTSTSLDPSAAQDKTSPPLETGTCRWNCAENEALQDEIPPKERQPDFQTTHSRCTFYFLCTVSFGEADTWISPHKKRGCPQKRPPDKWQPQQQGAGKAYFQSWRLGLQSGCSTTKPLSADTSVYVAHGLGRKTTNSDGKPDSARSNGGYCTSKFENSYWVSVESQTLKVYALQGDLDIGWPEKHPSSHGHTHNLLCQSKVLSSADRTLFHGGKKENNNKVYKNEQKPLHPFSCCITKHKPHGQSLPGKTTGS